MAFESHVTVEYQLKSIHSPRAITLARMVLTSRAIIARGRPLGQPTPRRRRRQRSALANEVKPDPPPARVWMDGAVVLPVWLDASWMAGPCGLYRVPSEVEREALGDSAAFY